MINILVPVKNEEKSIVSFYNEIKKELQKEKIIFRILFIDDGSTDNSWKSVINLNVNNVSGIKLNRNYGKEQALLIGINELNKFKYSLCCFMDVDLQHPPRYLPLMIDLYKKTGKSIIGLREDTVLPLYRIILSKIYFKILSILLLKNIPYGITDFCLVNEYAISKLLENDIIYPVKLKLIQNKNDIYFLKFKCGERIQDNSKFNFFNLLSYAIKILTLNVSLILILSFFLILNIFLFNNNILLALCSSIIMTLCIQRYRKKFIKKIINERFIIERNNI